MAWRFKASKYKNAAPIVPKPEACIRDIVVGSYQTYGNNIAASAAFMAFNWEHTGSSVAVLPLDDCGRKSKTMPLLHGHTDTVTDLEFSPFHDGLLATASQDCIVKIWHIPEKGLEATLSDPECAFSHKQRRVETVGFHPTADGLLHSTAAGCVTLFDITAQKEIFSNNEHPEVIQSASWKQDGKVLATSCKDKHVRVVDPRSSNPIEMTAESHQSIKDSRVVWIGSQTRILTTGFDAARVRQVIIRDIRNFNTPEKILGLDCSTGILMPLFDPDTNMLFLCGKGDTTINYLEVTDRDPYLIEGLRHTGEQTKGACLVPKRALKVMDGEVNRVLQLTSNMVIPIMYQVPRKNYRDFHSDLYPETTGYKTNLTASEWLAGANTPVPKMSLDPAKRELGDAPIIIHRGNLKELIKNIENQKAKATKSVGNQSATTVPATNAATLATNTAYGVKPFTKLSQRNGNDHSDSPHIVLKKTGKKSEDNAQQKEKNGNMHEIIEKNSGECVLSKEEIIRKFDAKYKADLSEKDDKAVDNHGNGAHQRISSHEENSPVDDSTGSSEDASSSASYPVNQQQQQGQAGVAVPKPLPRTSRHNSLTPEAIVGVAQQEQQSLTVRRSSEDSVVTTPQPQPRPRTAAASYKPRLGPKPFSSNSGEVSFDKVFAVPIAPGSTENIHHLTSGTTQVVTNLATNGTSHSTSHSDDVGEHSTNLETKVGDSKPDILDHVEIREKVLQDSTNNPDGHHATSPGNGITRSLSTSERRKSSADEDENESPEKIFEKNHSECSENSTEGEDRTDAELRRFTSARSSIAERRRLYESSISNENEKSQSPVPLRRDVVSMKNADTFKEPSVPHHKPQSNITSVGGDLKRISVPEGKLMDDRKRNVQPNASVIDNGSASGIKKSATETTINSHSTTKRTSTVFGKVSKFRHLKGTPGHKSTHIENLRNLSRQIPGECNGFHANHERVAVPLSGPGGKIAIFELSRPGRLPDGVIPSFVNGYNIMDFQWDPFDPRRLAVACDDGTVKLWHVPEGGLTEPTNQPERDLPAHSDKIYFIRFHPLAQDVLLTASYDMTIKLWNLSIPETSEAEQLVLTGHTDQIFDFAWSPCGRYGATVSRDGKIRVYEPRKSAEPIREGNGPVGTRGARITWAVDGQYIVCTGFDKVSERQISVYNAQKLKTPLNTFGLDVSPSILIPFYDEDSSTLFVTGKGDSTIYCFEITDEEPYICQLSHHRCSSLHQGLSFLTKNHCDVASVEFSKAFRLTNTTIEPLSFTVPRIKNELFQDDLFPPTRVTWTPTLCASEWFNSVDKQPSKISLQPEGMESLSSIHQSAPPPTQAKIAGNNGNSSGSFATKSEYEKSKQQEIQKSVSARMEYNTKLEQDEMEGVDEQEWQE